MGEFKQVATATTDAATATATESKSVGGARDGKRGQATAGCSLQDAMAQAVLGACAGSGTGTQAAAGSIYADRIAFLEAREDANCVADHHFTARNANASALLVASQEALNAYHSNAQLRDAEEGWKSVAKSLLWAGLGALPGLGPVTGAIQRVATTHGEFYAKALGFGLDMLTSDIPKFAASYKPSDAPELSKETSSAADVLYKFSETTIAESKRWLEISLALAAAWSANENATDKEPWRTDVLELAQTVLQPNDGINDTEAVTRMFERLLWEGLLASGKVSAGPVNTMVGSVKLGFRGLSAASADYLAGRFGWSHAEIYRRVPHVDWDAQLLDSDIATVDWPSELELPKSAAHEALAGCHSGQPMQGPPLPQDTTGLGTSSNNACASCHDGGASSSYR